MADAVVGLGANLGDPLATLSAARAALAVLSETTLVRCSSIYKTAPVGFLDQPDFLNAVCWLKTALTAERLAAELFALEGRLGRVRTDLRNGPRTVDLDLLFYEGVSCARPDLELPHPRLHERAFVLYPWLEIMPGFVLPEHGPLRELCRGVPGQRVERLEAVW